jgi:hypothetical protein
MTGSGFLLSSAMLAQAETGFVESHVPRAGRGAPGFFL